MQAHRSSEAARQNAEKLAAKLREEEALQAAMQDAEAYKLVGGSGCFINL